MKHPLSGNRFRLVEIQERSRGPAPSLWRIGTPGGTVNGPSDWDRDAAREQISLRARKNAANCTRVSC